MRVHKISYKFHHLGFFLRPTDQTQALVENDDVEKMRTVREKSLKTFIESSMKRTDGEHVQLSKNSTLEVYRRYRKNYSNERMIAVHLKKMEQGRSKSKDILLQ